MKSSAELERELEAAKKAEQDIQDEISLKDARKWIGKCYSSHLFQRVPRNMKSIHVRKVTNVRVEDGRVWYEGINIEFQFDKQSKRLRVEIGTRNFNDRPFPTWISNWSHEISEDQFNTLLVEATVHADTYFDKLAEVFKQDQYINMGDSNDERNKIKLLSKRNTFIDLSKEKGYETVKDILSWNNHPFLYDHSHLLFSKESIEIVKDIADEMEESARRWKGSILERDAPRIAKLRAFYKEHILNFQK